LYVHPQAWSTGAGRELWLAARERLQSQGSSSISLWVLERNARAIRFYSEAGFTIETGSEKELALGGTKVREVRLVHAS
jgi:ribosomal protein S18 acetylase RimI-like enzyme